jgi:hypothetical protein
MTRQQEEQFNKFGCVARCIIKAAEIKGQPITNDAFCDRFATLFPENEYGGLLTSQIVEVIREIGLGKHFLTFRRYGEIEGRFNLDKTAILVCSEIDPNPESSLFTKHCNLLISINECGFSLFIPFNDGTERVQTYKRDDWDSKLCHGIVILN